MRLSTLFALFVALGLASTPAIADNQQGQACSPNGIVSGATKNGAADDGNNLVCVGGAWQYPSYALQSAAAAAGTSCSGYPTGAMRYNSTLSTLEFCNGSLWGQVPAAATACSAPSGLSFTNLTSQALSTLVSSSTATITYSGCSGALSVTVSGAATAQISINGGAWAASGTITSGQTLQVRMTTSSSANTTLSSTITVGTASTTWTTTTLAGALKMFVTATSQTPLSLGSVSGADAVCQSNASTAGYAGTYKALISDETTDAKDRLTLSYPIVNAYDGTTIAAANLWVGSINNYAKRPNGLGVSYVITGTTPTGTKETGLTCNSWTGGTNVRFGSAGSSYIGGGSWVQNFSDSCTLSAYLYCVQQ